MKSVRSILIGGPARSGKTRLARQVSASLQTSHIPLDSLVSSFQSHFPQTGIKHEGLEWDIICANFFPFLKTFLHELSYEGASFVCDTYHIAPQAAAELRSAEGLAVVFLGYPDIDDACKIDSIRQFRAAHDWTDSLSDQALAALVTRFKVESRYVRAECAKYEIPFFDTGADFTAALTDAHQWLLCNAPTPPKDWAQ